MTDPDRILDALCSVEIPFGTNEAARRGFVMAINEDGTLNPEKLRQYYEQRLENDGKVWEWLAESMKRAAEAAEKKKLEGA